MAHLGFFSVETLVGFDVVVFEEEREVLVGIGIGEAGFVEDGIEKAVVVEVLEGFELVGMEVAERSAEGHLDGEGLDVLGEVGDGAFEFIALA